MVLYSRYDYFTITLTAVRTPVLAMAQTVQLPAPVAFTLPFLSTVATLTLLLYQRTRRTCCSGFLLAFTPSTLARRVARRPTFRVSLLLFSVTDLALQYLPS